MIPVKLSLRNFMPYRDNVPPLDFTGIHTASISGDNGSGKSALIDAITWALWGQTRAGARNHDSLIHSQQSEMQVEFDFKVGDQLYRVIRKHAKPKRRQASGQSSLDLLLITEGSPQLMSGDRIAETQHKITDIIHMDYDTFVNSSYLRQGHADQFTVAESTDRKKVLANILGLSRYDTLEEQARELTKQQDNEKALAESTIRDIDSQLAAKPAGEASLKEAEDKLRLLEKAGNEAEVRLNDPRQKQERLTGKQRELAQIEQHLAETSRTLSRENDRIKQHQAEIKEYEQLISQRGSIEEGYTQLVQAKKLNEELNRRLALVEKLNRRKYELDIAIERAQAAIVTEHKLVETKIGELETSAQKLPQLKTELQQAETVLNQLAGEDEQLKQKRESEQQLRTIIHNLESDMVRLQQETAELDEKVSLLAAHTEAVCPLCERELGEDHRQLIETKYNADKQQKTEALKSTGGEVARKQAELKTINTETLKTEQRLSKLTPDAQRTAGLLQQRINSVGEALKQLDEETKRLTEIEERLASKDFAASEQAALAQLEGELSKLDYHSPQHEEVRHRLTDMEQYDVPKRKLEEADRLVEQAKESLASAGQAAKELSRNLETDNQKRQELTVELSGLGQLAAELARIEIEYQRFGSELSQSQETLGSIRGRLEHMEQLEVARKGKETSLSQVVKEAGIYKELAEAFGKNGIQALLIEMALPELQDEANRLLTRMTDNRMHVKFETQRETKKGDVSETLDIQISDELGTRSYEMFSGGEAFRINFAIRIALSKLLARRAGAPLPTLIIDEGFGTQDQTGMEKLKEAITSIQDDFEKILVITHVEELRDAFPTRINVVKTAEGSTIEVS